MPALVSRILLTGLLIPAALLLDLVIYLGLDRSMSFSSRGLALVTNTAAALFIMIGWLLIWRSIVHWTSRRVLTTLLSVAASGVIAVAAGSIVSRAFDDEVGIFAAAMGCPILWCGATAFFWRETTAERAVRLTRQAGPELVCPACGYNLAGLHEARCPECGGEYTLDVLYAAQPGRAVSDVESA
jgi:hypothetical protein